MEQAINCIVPRFESIAKTANTFLKSRKPVTFVNVVVGFAKSVKCGQDFGLELIYTVIERFDSTRIGFCKTILFLILAKDHLMLKLRLRHNQMMESATMTRPITKAPIRTTATNVSIVYSELLENRMN